jgi:chemotaxis protein histidine kinase CheA
LLERDKRVLSQRAEVLTLEVTRLKQSLESVTRQHALSQAALAEYQRTQPQAAAAAAHDDAMATARELNLLRDANAMMRSREEAKEALARAATEALAALQAQMEPTQQKLVAAESARAALVAQLEQERAACQTWQRRNSELLDKTATSVGQEAYKELDRAKEEMQKQLEGARAEADAAKAAKDSAEKELEEMKKTEKKLRGTGAKFRDDAAAANKLLDEERAEKPEPIFGFFKTIVQLHLELDQKALIGPDLDLIPHGRSREDIAHIPPQRDLDGDGPHVPIRRHFDADFVDLDLVDPHPKKERSKILAEIISEDLKSHPRDRITAFHPGLIVLTPIGSRSRPDRGTGPFHSNGGSRGRGRCRRGDPLLRLQWRRQQRGAKQPRQQEQAAAETIAMGSIWHSQTVSKTRG